MIRRDPTDTATLTSRPRTMRIPLRMAIMGLTVIVLALAMSGWGNWTWAQPDGAAVVNPGSGTGTDPGTDPGADPGAAVMPTLQQLFGFSPVINSMIAALSILALLLFVYFLASISTRAMMPQEFVNDVTKLVLADKLSDVAELCRRRPGVLAAGIIQRCVENAGKGHDVIMDIIDSEGRRRADLVWNRISYLADISNVAPMFGLLGTVLGMTEAFFGLELQSASINSGILANSIGKAMSTTMFGLVVAILALGFYSLIKARATRTLAEVEQLVHSIADHVKRDDTAPLTERNK